MVKDAGQLYTIEGVAAAVLLLVTVYIVLGTTTIFTPSDSHINDAQLEQLGNDALAMMDTPTQFDNSAPDIYTEKESDLEKYIMTSDSAGLSKNFNIALLNFLNAETISPDHLNYKAVIWYRRLDNTLGMYDFTQSSSITGREHFVRVTRLVTLNGKPPDAPPILVPADMRPVGQTVLLDVMIWRN